MTTDYFALLGELRRPWLDPDSLKQKFLALAAEVHPDRAHRAGNEERHVAQQRYTELNAAFQCLREPKTRLRHLIELESGEKPTDVLQIAPTLMDLFNEVSQGCREADILLSEKTKNSSPLLQVQWFTRSQELADGLNTLKGRIEAQRGELFTEFEAMNSAWEAAPVDAPARRRALPLGRLEAVYRLLGFLDRWAGQLQERRVRLLIG